MSETGGNLSGFIAKFASNSPRFGYFKGIDQDTSNQDIIHI